MQVLYISQYYPPEACAPATRVDCFTREWVRAGAEVRVLTGFPNHPEGILHAEYRKALAARFRARGTGGSQGLPDVALPFRQSEAVGPRRQFHFLCRFPPPWRDPAWPRVMAWSSPPRPRFWSGYRGG